MRSALCSGCRSQINRSNHCSTCSHCGVIAHPKCAPTLPKTCGLPEGLVKHFAKSITGKLSSEVISSNSENIKNNTVNIEGWIKLWNGSKNIFEKKYARLEENKILFYGDEPSNRQANPVIELNLCPEDGHVVVADAVSHDFLDFSNVSDTSLPLIIKVVALRGSLLKQCHYLLVNSFDDKTNWITALDNAIVHNADPKNHVSILHTFSSQNILDLKCVTQINEKILLFGAEEGVFSFKLNVPKQQPVKIGGINSLYQVTLIPEFGVALMIVDKGRKLVTCDYLALTSNAEAAACSNPCIPVKALEAELEQETCLLFEVSPVVNSIGFLTVATCNKLFIFKWCLKNSEFVRAKVLETLHPCNCVVYTKHSVIVGCDKFFEIKLKDFSVQEFLDPSIKSLAFWKIGSFPMKIFQTSEWEYLLCFNEFGVFVNENGVKTQCDLKWKRVPCDFAYSKPYLFVLHNTSVEVIRVPTLDFKSDENSICSSSTATFCDSSHVDLNNPRYLGNSSKCGAIFVKEDTSPGFHLMMLEGAKVCKDDLGSCPSLDFISDFESNKDNKNDDDEFSFTSSIVQSLEEMGTSTPRQSDDESCTTYTISDNDKTVTNKKAVKFVQKAT